MNKYAMGFFAVISVLLLVGLIGTAATGTDQPWRAPDDAKKMKNPVTPTSQGLMVASELYEQKCVLCHGETGGGDGPVAQSLQQKPADFTDTRKMKDVTDGELFWKMSTGRGSMPSWQDRSVGNGALATGELSARTGHLRTLQIFRKADPAPIGILAAGTLVS